MQKVTVVSSGQLATSVLILSPFRGETTHAKPKTNLLLIDPIRNGMWLPTAVWNFRL